MSQRLRAWPLRLAAVAVAAALVFLGVAWRTGSAAPTAQSGSAHTVVQPASAVHQQAASARVVAVADKVYVIGDSLTVGTEPWLARAVRGRGWTLTGVSARVGRPVPQGLDVLRRHAARLPATVIIALGTNDLGSSPRTVASWLRAARSIVGPSRRLVWVNLCLDDKTAPRLSGFRSINASLTRFAPRYGVQIANWCGFATSHGITPGPDGIHYYPSAYRQRARFYAAALTAA